MPVFDLDNAVQQGLNRDIDNNDWNVEARNLEIVLEDNGGTGQFRIHDSDNVEVVVANSDGYLSVNGNAEVHGGNLLVEHRTGTNVELITLEDSVDQAGIFLLDSDPNGVISAERSSLGLNYGDGYIYVNRDGITDWSRLVYADEVDSSGTVTLQIAYKNDADGGDAIITTDATDGSVVIAGTESFRVTATGGIDLDTGFDMDGAGPFDVDITGAVSIDSDAASNISVDGANLTLETVNSGDILVNLPGSSGDLTLSDGTNNYVETVTAIRELRLGDASGSQVITRILDDLIVDGNLQVDGYETILNTEELFVEDRMIRLNVNAPAGFSGTTGFEAEVGSDGYVEFHWDDTSECWEISIDRSLASGGQTFRPLPYLASSPATKDLSSTGVDGYSAHNSTSGAAVVNTDKDNFPCSFGQLMTGDSVQHALEAIDAYMCFTIPTAIAEAVGDLTLQEVFDNSINGGNVTLDIGNNQFDIVGTGDICIDVDGYVKIDAGDEIRLITNGDLLVDVENDVIMNVTNDMIVDVDDDLFVNVAGDINIDGYGDANIQINDGDLNITATGPTGTINIDGYDGVDITSPNGDVLIDGYEGIVLDGNGNGVVPANSCEDALGSPTAGWDDIYLCNSLHGDIVVALSAAGSTTTHNSTAGADLVGTNSANFATYGPDMTDNSVQSALEAIDGYLQSVADQIEAPDITLQEVFDNSVVNDTVTLDLGDNVLEIIGSGDICIDIDGYFKVNAAEDIFFITEGDINNDVEGDIITDVEGDIITDVAGNIIIDGYGDMNVTIHDGDVNITATGPTGTVNIDGYDGVDITSENGDIFLDGYEGIVIDGNGNGLVPLNSCADDLGSATSGWGDIYLCNSLHGDIVVALSDAGAGGGAHNTTAGADLVGTNSTNFDTFGGDMTDNTVQSALEAIDGYLQNLTIDDIANTTFTQERGLELNGAVLNGNVRTATVGSMASFLLRPARLSRMSWTIPVPKDWDGASDITVEVVWSPSNTNGGDVEWRMEYLGRTTTELASAAATTVDVTQAANGTTDAIQTASFTISAGDIATTDEVILVNIVRRGPAGGDTFTGRAQVHLVKYSYTADNIVS